MGLALLAAALTVSFLLVAVFVALVRARLKEREQLESGELADREELAAKKKHRPRLAPWLACSGAALVLCTALALLWLKGCQTLGRTVSQGQEQYACQESLAMQADWFGPYWDQNKKLPGPEEVPLVNIECPRHSQFVYVGHRKISLGGARVLIVELDAHPDGSRRVLLVDESFLAAKKTVAQASGMGAGGMAGTWQNRTYFRAEPLDEHRYETIREAVERLEEDEEEVK